jgi:hypothetical protein
MLCIEEIIAQYFLQFLQAHGHLGVEALTRNLGTSVFIAREKFPVLRIHVHSQKGRKELFVAPTSIQSTVSHL